MIVQYPHWLAAALHGDLGRSYTTQQSVAQCHWRVHPGNSGTDAVVDPVGDRAGGGPNTIPTRGLLITRLTTAANLVGITVPNFMLGISLIFVFSVVLGWLPSTGWVPWSDGVLPHLSHMIMPVLTLSSYYFGVFSIVYRAEFRDVVTRMFIRVARAKGSANGVSPFATPCRTRSCR